VLLSNHPQLAGGSHLPDITVITPVFSGGRVVFFVASRGHHADIGGISPGSMPPNSKLLVEEGAAVVSFKLVKNGVFQVGRGAHQHCVSAAAAVAAAAFSSGQLQAGVPGGGVGGGYDGWVAAHQHCVSSSAAAAAALSSGQLQAG
jgi:hypothetical protein